MKKKPKIATVRLKCDKLWSQLIRSVGHCEYCGTTQNLNAHHLVSRSKLHTRYLKENGICLCVKHHTFSKDFSAHGNPLAFGKWIEEYYGKERIDFLLKESRSLKRFTIDDYLKAEIDLKQMIDYI